MPHDESKTSWNAKSCLKVEGVVSDLLMVQIECYEISRTISAVCDVPRPHTCYGLPVHKHCNCLDTAASRPRVQGKMLRLIILPGKCQILFTDLPLIVHISYKNSVMSHVVKH